MPDRLPAVVQDRSPNVPERLCSCPLPVAVSNSLGMFVHRRKLNQFYQTGCTLTHLLNSGPSLLSHTDGGTLPVPLTLIFWPVALLLHLDLTAMPAQGVLGIVCYWHFRREVSNEKPLAPFSVLTNSAIPAAMSGSDISPASAWASKDWVRAIACSNVTVSLLLKENYA